MVAVVKEMVASIWVLRALYEMSSLMTAAAGRELVMAMIKDMLAQVVTHSSNCKTNLPATSC